MSKIIVLAFGLSLAFTQMAMADEPTYASELERQMERNENARFRKGASQVIGFGSIGAFAVCAPNRNFFTKTRLRFVLGIGCMTAGMAGSGIGVLGYVKYEKEEQYSRLSVSIPLEDYLREAGITTRDTDIADQLIEGIPLSEVLSSVDYPKKALPTATRRFEVLPKKVKRQIESYNQSIGAE